MLFIFKILYVKIYTNFKSKMREIQLYKIKINNMKFHSYIGVYEEEKKIGQNIEIDLIISLSKEIIKNDDINNI